MHDVVGLSLSEDFKLWQPVIFRFLLLYTYICTWNTQLYADLQMYKVYRDPEGKSEMSSATNHSFHYNEKMYKEQIQKLNREVVDLKMVGTNKSL